MKNPTQHPGTPAKYFAVPLIDWLTFVPCEFTPLETRLPGDPTPEELRERCEAVQATWSKFQRNRAGGDYLQPRVVMPTASEQTIYSYKKWLK